MPDNNEAPIFTTTALAFIEVHLNNPVTYPLPVSDPEGHRITASLFTASTSNPVPLFVKTDGSYVKFKPTLLSEVGYYDYVMVKIKDQYQKEQTLNTPYLRFRVRNDPPKFLIPLST